MGRRKSNKGKIAAAVVIIAFILIAALAWYQSSSSVPAPKSAGKVLLVTSKGNITIELFSNMPITTANFVNLTRMGIYDNTIFHRVVENFVIQGGDVSGKGINVPTIPDENIGLNHNVQYSVAMAKTQMPNSATSQFYINLKDNSQTLDSNYSVFGKVIGGTSVVDVIGKVPTAKINGTDTPVNDVDLITASLID